MLCINCKHKKMLPSVIWLPFIILRNILFCVKQMKKIHTGLNDRRARECLLLGEPYMFI